MNNFSKFKKVSNYFKKIKNYFLAHEYISATLFFILLITIFFFPVIFSGKTLTTSNFGGGVMSSGPYQYDGARPPMLPVRDPGAFDWVDEPLTNYIGKVIKTEHHIPLWNPNMGLGYPILGGLQVGIFFPLNFINFLFSSELSWDIFFLIRIFLAGFFTYVFVRKIGLEKKPAFLAGTIFMLSGYVMNYLNMAHFSTEVLIPLFLLSVEYFLEKRNTKSFILYILALVLIILPGMPEATALAAILGGLWFIFSIFFIHKEISKKIKFFSVFVIANLLAFALSAIQLIPFFEFLKNSFNAHSGSLVGLSAIPFNTITSIFHPFFFNPLYSWFNQFTYLGISIVILFFLALFSLRSFEKKEVKIIVFFSLFTLLLLAKVFGVTFINWIGSLPVLNVLIFPKYAAPAIIFSVAIVAAFGYSLLIRKKIPFLNTKLFVIFLTIVSLAFYSLQQNMTDIINIISKTDPFAKEIFKYLLNLLHISLPVKFLDTILYSSTIPYLILVIFSGVFIFLVFWIITLNINKKIFPAMIILIFVVAELYVYAFPLKRTDRYDTFKKAPYISYLQKDKSTFRVYGQMPNESNAMLFPNTSSVFGIQDIRTIMAIEDKRYFMFLKNVLGITDWEMNNIRFIGNSQIPFDNKFFNLLNVKYFLSPSGTNDYAIFDKIKNESKFIAGNKEYFAPSSAILNGKQLQGFLLHAPSKIEFPIDTNKNKHFIFEYGIAQSGIKDSDGVQFSVVAINNNGTEIPLLKDFVNPKNSKYNNWQKTDLDLSLFKGEKISLSFQSDPVGNNMFDHFFFGNFKTIQDDSDVVYDNEINIIENKNVFPRAFIVHRAENLSNQDEIFARLKSADFNIRKQIIIEKNLPENILNGNSAPETDNSTATITNYKDQEVFIDTIMENDGFLILTDQYYPGWKAYVDGIETEIYPTDYIFRSVYLNKGNHEVRFVYDPMSYKAGKYISLITLLALVGLFIKRKSIDKYLNETKLKKIEN